MKCLVKRIGHDLYKLYVDAETSSIEDDFQMNFMVIRSKNCYELKIRISAINRMFAQPKKFYTSGDCESHFITEIIRYLLMANKIISRDANIHFEI